MNNKFIDPSIKRKNNIVKEKFSFYDGVILPSIIEFNIFGNCNRNCDFCPVSNPKIYDKKNEGISVELFNKIINDLKNIDYQGKILFSAFCEPLLHKNIEELIKIVKQNLPKTRLEIVSNGDLLTSKKLKKLVEAGLDTINVSMYDGKHQIEYFKNIQKEAGVIDENIVLRRRYYENGNYGITISNRVGLVDSNEFRDEDEEKIEELPLNKSCYYPFYMILIDYNGDVLLCPHDWSKNIILGNLENDAFLDIWKGNILNNIRKKLINSDRNFIPCNKCDVHGDLIGKEHFSEWRTLLK